MWERCRIQVDLFIIPPHVFWSNFFSTPHKMSNLDKRSLCIVGFNILLFCLGVAVLGLSIAMSVIFQRGGWTAVISAQAIGLSVFAGLLMMINGIAGCYSAKQRNRRMLCANLLCVFALFIVLVVAASMLIRYSVVAQNQVDLQSSELQAEDDKYMNNALISVYNKCCSGCNNVDIALFTNSLQHTCNMLSNPSAGDDFELENNGWTANRCNVTLQQQYFPGHPTVLCENPGPCNASPWNVDNCWIYPMQDNLTAAVDFPPQYIDKGFCNTLNDLYIHGSPLVGFPQTGGCGSGMVRKFVDAMKLYFAPVFYAIGVVFIVFAVLIVLVLLVGVHIVGTHTKVNHLPLAPVEGQQIECTPQNGNVV